MADIKVSNLTVGITSDQKQFASAADESTRALQKQKNASKNAAKGLKDFKDGLKQSTAEAKRHVSSIEKIAAAVKRIAFYRMIRSAIKAVTQAMREGINNLYQYSTALNSLDAAHAKDTMDGFATTALYVKNSLGAALMPVLASLLPVVNAVADAFVWAANAVNQFLQAIRGRATFTKAKRYATEFGEALGGAAGKAKELKKQVFGFDELNIFNAPSNGGGGGGGGLDYSKMFEEAEVSANWGKLKELVKNNLAGIELIVGAAELAVGAILALSGVNIPLGIGLMAVGAATMAAGMLNWSKIDSSVAKAVEKIAGTVGVAFLALGAILAFSGANLPLGIALIGLGALSLAAAAGIQWDFLGNTIDEKVGFITAIVSTAFLFLGAALALTGNLPLGLGLLALGAAGLAAGLSMNDTLRNAVFEKIKEIKDTVSIMSLALGAILMFIPGMQPLGIGLLALGAVGLASSLFMNDKLKKEIHEKFKAIEAILGLSLAGLGAALLFVNPAIGLPLLITGLGLIADSLDWDALYKKIGEAWEKVKQKGREIKKDLLGWWESIKSFFKNIVNFNASLKVDSDLTKPGQTNAYGYERRASGGEVSTGTFFLAGESGPELVGQVGNKTTVTNQEQFTAGMEGIMDNTNSVIMQAASALIQAIQNKDMSVIVPISDRTIVSAYDRGKTLAGTALVE